MIRLKTFSFRFAEQVLNSKLSLKQEIEGVLTNTKVNLCSLSRPNYNELLDTQFVKMNWKRQPLVFSEHKT